MTLQDTLGRQEKSATGDGNQRKSANAGATIGAFPIPADRKRENISDAQVNEMIQFRSHVAQYRSSV
jgi:hypothetical protein